MIVGCRVEDRGSQGNKTCFAVSYNQYAVSGMQMMKIDKFKLPQLFFGRRVSYAQCYSRDLHSIHEHQIFHLLSGSMTLELASGMSYRAVPGDTLFLPADTMHRDRFNASRGPELLHLRFLWEDAPLFFSLASPDCVQHFPPAVRADIASQFYLLHLPHERMDGGFNSEWQRSRVALQLGAILALCMENLTCQNRRNEDADDLRFDEARRYIGDQIENPLTLGSVAAHLQISPSTLSRVFRRCAGIPFHQYLLDQRLNAARTLLEKGNCSLAVIAQKLGFCDAGYFGKAFKKKFGISPGKFR